MKKEYLYRFLTEYTANGIIYGEGIWAKTREEAEEILQQKSSTEKIIGQQANPEGRGMYKKTKEELYGL